MLRLGAGGRLLGLDPDTALAVDRLPSQLAAMVDELAEPVDSAGLVARATERGASTEAAVQLLLELLQVGAIIDAEPVERSARQRAQSVVVVSGDGPLTVGVVLGLVQAGVGRVQVDTAGVVLACDLGTGYLDADRGHDRLTATQDAAHRIRPDAEAVVAPGRRVPDLVVLADALGPEPERVARLHVGGTPHLPVRLRDGIGVVGPLVLPGRSACLGCLELSRRDRAPCWPTVAAQLTGRRGRADPASTAATAALATAQAVAALDALAGGGARPPTLEATIELDATAGTIVKRRWHPVAGCGCGAASARRGSAGVVHHDIATSAQPTEGETIMV